MSNEEKELLIKDLCARFPYGLLIDTPRGTFELDAIAGDLISLKDKEGRLSDLLQDTDGKYWFPIVTGNYKPYLRPMESMTEEEFSTINVRSCLMPPCDNGVRIVNYGQLSFLNSHHFDYRGLIEKGLALPAPEDMYN